MFFSEHVFLVALFPGVNSASMHVVNWLWRRRTDVWVIQKVVQACVSLVKVIKSIQPDQILSIIRRKMWADVMEEGWVEGLFIIGPPFRSPIICNIQAQAWGTDQREGWADGCICNWEQGFAIHEGFKRIEDDTFVIIFVFPIGFIAPSGFAGRFDFQVEYFFEWDGEDGLIVDDDLVSEFVAFFLFGLVFLLHILLWDYHDN